MTVKTCYGLQIRQISSDFDTKFGTYHIIYSAVVFGMVHLSLFDTRLTKPNLTRCTFYNRHT